MVRIIVGPDPIKKHGLDHITKSLIKQIHKLTTENCCEVLFLEGLTKGDIQYLMRHILRILDMQMTIVTQVDINSIDEDTDFKGNKLKITVKII